MNDHDLQEKAQQLKRALRAEAAQTGASDDALRAQFDGRARAGSDWGQVPPAIAAASYGRERWYVSPGQRRREAERMRGRADDDAAVVPPASVLFEADPWETTAHVSSQTPAK